MGNIKSLEEMILENINRNVQEAAKDESHKEQSDIRTCKVCGQDKKRIFNGRYNFKDKRWVDENGKQWMGRTCPDCNVNRSKVTMRGTRAKAKNTNT